MSAPDWTKDWRPASRLLCIRLDYLGDVLMCTPALRALRESAPGRNITLMTSPSGAAATRHVPEADEAIIYAAPWMKSSVPHAPDADLGMIEQLRARHFDGAVIFTTYSQSPLPAALMCALAGIPLRLAHCRENPYQLLTHWVRETEPETQVRHEVRRQLDLAAAIGCRSGNDHLSFALDASDRARAAQRLLALGIEPGRPWILMHPGATAASRRYPADLWARAAALLAARTGFPIVFSGSAEEIALIETIRDAIRAGNAGLPVDGASRAVVTHSLAGDLDLGTLGALIHAAPVFVCNNTGPAHIAAAVGTPVVDLYALTNPQHTPWRVASRVLYHNVPCRNCYRSVCPEGHHACLAQVPPESVAEAAVELLRLHGRTAKAWPGHPTRAPVRAGSIVPGPEKGEIHAQTNL